MYLLKKKSLVQFYSPTNLVFFNEQPNFFSRVRALPNITSGQNPDFPRTGCFPSQTLDFKKSKKTFNKSLKYWKKNIIWVYSATPLKTATAYPMALFVTLLYFTFLYKSKTTVWAIYINLAVHLFPVDNVALWQRIQIHGFSRLSKNNFVNRKQSGGVI